MSERNLRGDGRAFQWTGVVACAAALSFVQWNLNTGSAEEPKLLTLFEYALINLACFSVVLLVTERWLGNKLGRLSKYAFVALAGAFSSSLLIDVSYFYKDIPNWRGDTVGWLMHAAFFVLFNCCVAALVMALVYFSSVVFKVKYN
jgi:hypothetical protein